MGTKSKYRKNQHLVARLRGDNGDLIVGRIDSVRANGLVTGENLLTHSRFVKEASVLDVRNVLVSKREAEQVMSAYETWPDHTIAAKRRAARDKAVEIATRQRSLEFGEWSAAPDERAASGPKPNVQRVLLTTLRALIDDTTPTEFFDVLTAEERAMMLAVCNAIGLSTRTDMRDAPGPAPHRTGTGFARFDAAIMHADHPSEDGWEEDLDVGDR